MEKKYRFICVLIFVASSVLFPQTKSNLDVFDKLIRESVIKIDSAYSGKNENKSVKISLPQTLEQLLPTVISAFKEKGFSVSEKNAEGSYENYILTDVLVEYKDSYADGLFGKIMVARSVRLDGAHFTSSPGGLETPVMFSKVNIDSVCVDDVESIESKSIPFTQGKIPPPPLLSNLIEPVIIVGTLITTVILLFTIRSK